MSLDPTAGELNPVQNLDVRESEDLIPTIQFLEKRNSEVIQARQDAGSCERWLLISDDTGHLHPGVSSKGRFVCRIGRIIYEYSCSAILVPIVETPYCTNSIPVAARGQLFYSNIDTHMISKHMHKLPCNPDFPIVVETQEGLLVSVQQRILQIKEPQSLHVEMFHPDPSLMH